MARIDERCNFCGKTKDKVRKLVAGPGVFICDQCIELCREVIHAEGPPVTGSSSVRSQVKRRPNPTSWFRNLFQARGYMT